MSRALTASNIRQAALHVRLPIAANYRRASMLPGLTAEQRSFLRLAARYIAGNVDNAEYDLIARLQLLEGAAGLAAPGPNAGTWWKMGRRGLRKARDHFAGTDIDPSWLSEGKTGLIGKTYAMVLREFRSWGGGSADAPASSPEDIVQNGIMGLTKSGDASSSSGPLFLYFGAKNKGTLGKNIPEGNVTPSQIAGAVAKYFVGKVKDEFREGDKTKRRAPTETETGGSIFDMLESGGRQIRLEEFVVAELQKKSPLGRKLEAQMRAIAAGNDFAHQVIDALVEGSGGIKSISALHKSLGGSGSGGAVRTIKTKFLPEVWKMLRNNRDLEMALFKAQGRLASRRKQAGLGSELLWLRVDRRKTIAVNQVLRKAGDQQSVKLLNEVMRTLMERLDPGDATERALNRFSNLVAGSHDPANLRNQVFKVANELGLKLPSGMF